MTVAVAEVVAEVVAEAVAVAVTVTVTVMALVNSANVCRDGATQLAYLDRIAGTSGSAASFASGVHSLRQMEQQLADIANLGDEEEREELQEMITEVKHDTAFTHVQTSNKLACILIQLCCSSCFVCIRACMPRFISGRFAVVDSRLSYYVCQSFSAGLFCFRLFHQL